MIYGIGTDIVEIARMQAGLERHGERFARKLLAPAEHAEFGATKRPACFLAKRFAAKEATVKALGTGMRDGIKLADIAVAHDSAGKPVLTCTGYTLALMQRLGINESHLSLSDERDYAVAFVILIRDARHLHVSA